MKTLNIRRAFTLVELLVVVVIIGILSSLVTVGVMSAVQAAKRSRIAMEMHQITLALETYKNKFGEYPPDLYDKAAVVRHVKKRWPRFQLYKPTPSVSPIDEQYCAFMNAISNVYRNNGKLTMLNNHYGSSSFLPETLFMDDPDNITREASYVGALVFWLGGFPNQDGKFSGFSADPEAPFGKEWDNSVTPPVVIRPNNGNYSTGWQYDNIILSTQDKDSVFYEMTLGKNIEYVATQSNIVFPILVNRDATVNKDGTTHVPYVYFKSNSSIGGSLAHTYLASSVPGSPRTNTYNAKFYAFNSVFSTGSSNAYQNLNVAVPYAKSGDPFESTGNATPPIWHEPERFQLIHPGLDGVFGNAIAGGGDIYTVSTTADETKIFTGRYFRSINTNATANNIGQSDFDNITNFSDYQQIKAILP